VEGAALQRRADDTLWADAEAEMRLFNVQLRRGNLNIKAVYPSDTLDFFVCSAQSFLRLSLGTIIV
jgi:hypothetical protein